MRRFAVPPPTPLSQRVLPLTRAPQLPLVQRSERVLLRQPLRLQGPHINLRRLLGGPLHVDGRWHKAAEQRRRFRVAAQQVRRNEIMITKYQQ